MERRTLFSSLSVGPDINISHSRGSEAEGAITIDPTNPSRMFVFSNEASGGMFSSYSTDGGKTWHNSVIATGRTSLPAACCDPSASFDQFGNLYACYVGESTGVFVLLSTDGGKDFKLLKRVTNDNVDQPTLTTGPGTKSGTGSVWVSYCDSNGNIAVSGANIYGKNSVGSFSSPKEIPGAGGNFGDIAIGPSGQVIVGWQDNTFSQHATNIFESVDPDGLGPKGFSKPIKITRSNVGGFDMIPAQSKRSIDAELGFAWDRSKSKHHGRIFAVYTDETPDESNNTDIYLRYSDNNGATWSSAKKVNDDTTKNSQFLPRIAIDQTTGNIAMSWYDARNAGSKNQDVEFWAAASTDGGASITKNVRVSAGKSNATRGSDFQFGDYTGLAFDAGSFFPLWADNSSAVKNPASPNMDMVTARVRIV
jgi:Neuraminidase (sialidase)